MNENFLNQQFNNIMMFIFKYKDLLKYKNKILKKFCVSLIIIVLILISFSITIRFIIPVSGCQIVGTFESDYYTPKKSFMQGDTIYGKAVDSVPWNFKLRFRDPNGNIIYSSNPIYDKQITCSWILDENASIGKWDMQVGKYIEGSWNWSTKPGRISYFEVIKKSQYTLTVNINSLGTVTKNPDQTTYSHGQIVKLTAYSDKGWTFDYWSGDLTSTNMIETIKMTSNKTVIAHFTENKYVQSITIYGQGIVSKNPDQESYTFGTLVKLTAIADNGWTFSRWDGNISGNTNPITIVMNVDKNINAYFKKKSINGGGTNNGGTNTDGTNENEHSENRHIENLLPVAKFSTVDYYKNYVNSEIIFNGSYSYDPDGYLISWKWDFGDGTNGEGERPTHIYLIPAMYNVSLTVTDNNGSTNISESKIMIIQANRPPSIPEIDGPTTSLNGLDYFYTVFSIDDDKDFVKYIIDWGDGFIDESEFLPNGAIYAKTHIWSSPGNYTIKVIANDNQTVALSELAVIIEESMSKKYHLQLFFLILITLILIILFIIFKKKIDKK